MTLLEIKQAIKHGIVVYWSNDLYTVQGENLNRLNIVCSSNNHCIGLTWLDGVTLNGKESEFYIK